VVGAGFEPAYS